MFGNRKGALRREMNDSLMASLEYCKNDWMARKKIIESSIDPSEEVVYQLRLSEAKYFFLLRTIRELKNY